MIRCTFATLVARAWKGPLAPGWPLDFEIGVRFWRAQFRYALATADLAEGRRYFDGLQTRTDEVYDVERRRSPSGVPRGDWVLPREPRSEATLLYLQTCADMRMPRWGCDQSLTLTHDAVDYVVVAYKD